MFTKPFKDLSRHDAPIAGGKGASLGEMTNAHIPVPGGFVVLSTTFDKFLEMADIGLEIETILGKVNSDQVQEIEGASKQIQTLILNTNLPQEIAQEINEEFKKLNAKYVAVRSSATAEDSVSAAWAGQLDSFLNTDEKTLLSNVKRCFASLFTPRAIFYRFEKKLDEQKISVAVVIQKMVNSEVSGIAFSVHPVTEDHNQIIIEAGYGLGEAIVSGQITPDSYVVTKNDLNISDKNVCTQERGIYRNLEQGGNQWQGIPKETGEKACLSDKQIIELAKLIINIENHYGFPCDIEWAYESGSFYIVQSRPITTLSSSSPIRESDKEALSYDLTAEILETKWYHLGKWIEPALAAEVWLEYGLVAQQFFSSKLDNKILYLNGDFFLSQHDSDIFQKEGYEAAKKHQTKFFENIYETVRTVAEEISVKSRQADSVIGFLEDYKKLTGVWMPLNNIALGIEKYVQEVNPEAFKWAKGFLDVKPLTFQQIDEMNSLRVKIENSLGQKIKKAKDIPDKYLAEVKAHLKKYEWLGTHHFLINRLTLNNWLTRLSSESVKTPDTGRRLSAEDKYLVWLLDIIGFARFKAAETSGYATYYFKDWLVEIAQAAGICYEDVVEHTISEISSNNLRIEIANRRRKNMGFYYNGQENILSIKQIKTCLEKLLRPGSNNEVELIGLAAQAGKARGIVKKVVSQEQMAGFKSGMILVAHETTPDIILAMQKCSAIVTDFGGLTSHAAIIARELKKPCVVGTKFATKVLNDGDEVEVDANQGVVKIIKS